jgi:hypothetical protein
MSQANLDIVKGVGYITTTPKKQNVNKTPSVRLKQAKSTGKSRQMAT